MKTLLTTCLTLITFISLSQVNPGTPSSATITLSAEQRTEQLEEIEGTLKKDQKALRKFERQISKSNDHIEDLELEINYNEKRQTDHVNQIAELKQSMAGFDLKALEDKAKRLGKEARKLDRENHHDAQTIARKKAHIEKLLSEISVLESDIAENAAGIDIRKDERDETLDIITRNGLVEKQTSIDQLDKELHALKTKNERMRMKSDREKQAISKNENLVKQTQQKVTQSEDKKAQLMLTSGSSAGSL